MYQCTSTGRGPPVPIHISGPQPSHSLAPAYTTLHSPRLTIAVYPIENTSLLPSMTDVHTPFKAEYTVSTIPVIQVNGESVEMNETTEEYVSSLDQPTPKERTVFT